MADPEIAFLFASGLLVGMFAAGAGASLLFAVLGASVALLALSFTASRLRSTGAILALAAGILAGAFYFNLHAVVSERNAKWPTERTTFEGLVTEVRPYGRNAHILTVSLRPPWQGEFRAVLPEPGAASYGDVREFEGKIVHDRERGNMLVGRSTRTTFLRQGDPVKHRLLDLKEWVLGRYAVLLPPAEAGLLGGLTLGARASFPEDLKRDFARSGTTHLVALSGYNIGILILVFAGTLGTFFSRRTTFGLTVTGIVLFVLMTGAEASIVRAAIMGSLLLVAREAGRIYSIRHALVYAAVAMAAAEPAILSADLGFQLSFMSFLGVGYLAPAFARICRTEPKGGWLDWKENLFTTLGAQAAVLPLLLSHFGSFPLASIPANLILLPFVPFTMALGFLIALLDALSAYAALVAGWLAHILLAFELGIIRLAAAAPTTLHFDPQSPIFAFGYYAVLALIALGGAPRKSHPQPSATREMVR